MVDLQWIYSEFTVDLWWIYSEFTVDVWWIYSGFIVNLWWIYGGFIVDLWWIYGGFIVDLWWIYIYIVDLQWIYSGFMVDLQWTFAGTPSTLKQRICSTVSHFFLLNKHILFRYSSSIADIPSIDGPPDIDVSTMFYGDFIRDFPSQLW